MGNLVALQTNQRTGATLQSAACGVTAYLGNHVKTCVFSQYREDSLISLRAQ
jgi:hypothetical protein